MEQTVLHKKELEYFFVEESYGGNQDLFTDVTMRDGGCGACALRMTLRPASRSFFASLYGRLWGIPERCEGHTASDGRISRDTYI